MPHRFRPYIRQGILEWNKAFEKAGFADAIEARIQQDYEDWTPEDARYTRSGWVVDAGFAIGSIPCEPVVDRSDIDADILISDVFIRSWQQQYKTYFDELAHERDHPMDHTSQFQCQMASGLTRQMGFMASVLQARGVVGEDGELPEELSGKPTKH